MNYKVKTKNKLGRVSKASMLDIINICRMNYYDNDILKEESVYFDGKTIKKSNAYTDWKEKNVSPINRQFLLRNKNMQKKALKDISKSYKYIRKIRKSIHMHKNNYTLSPSQVEDLWGIGFGLDVCPHNNNKGDGDFIWIENNMVFKRRCEIKSCMTTNNWGNSFGKFEDQQWSDLLITIIDYDMDTCYFYCITDFNEETYISLKKQIERERHRICLKPILDKMNIQPIGELNLLKGKFLYSNMFN